jgi:hypothetical protein
MANTIISVRLRQLASISVAVVVLLFVLGGLYQLLGTTLDSRRFPQRGKSIQAGQVKLNMDCGGTAARQILL